MDVHTLEQAQFPSASLDDWRRLVGKVLKGADFDEALVSTTRDGIRIMPLVARRADPDVLGRKDPAKNWTIAQRFDDPNGQRALQQAATDLTNGATGLNLVLEGSISAFGTGVPASSSFAIPTFPDNAVSLRLDHPLGQIASDLFEASLERSRDCDVHLGIDLFSATLSSPSRSDTDAETVLQRAVDALNKKLRKGTVLNAEGRFAHNCGATEAQELAIVAASLIEACRLLEPFGVSPETVLHSTSLCVAVNQNQYLDIAKLRALRKMTLQIQAILNVAPALLHLFAETSWRMLTELDPETNILRNTLAAFSAGIAGADEISVLPHTLALGLPDPLARRLARNTQLVLADECHLGFVGDAAAGSGSLEQLTDDLAKTAWSLLQEIEKAGGLSKAISGGLIHQWVETAVASAKPTPIVGTTLYPQKTERPVNILQPLSFARSGTGLQPERLDVLSRRNPGAAQ